MSKQSLVFSVELYRINIQVSMHTSFCTKLQQSRSTSTPLQSCKSVWFAAFSCVILQHLPIVIWFLKYLTCVIYSSRQIQTHTHTHKMHQPIWFYSFLKGCGGTLTTASGSFSSPNYPLPYHPNAECYWTIRTSQGSQLLLSFSDFHLESSTACHYDYLAVSTAPHNMCLYYAVV